MEKKDILLKVIDYYCKGNKRQFAMMIGVPAQNISAWLRRNSFDVDIISTKCKEINPTWLLTGEGDMLIEKASEVQDVPNYDARINELLTICTMQQESIGQLHQDITSLVTAIRALVSRNDMQTYSMVAEDTPAMNAYNELVEFEKSKHKESV